MAIRNPGFSVNAALAQMNMRRHTRRPSHTFQLKYKPFQLQPFLLAPVMPNETLTNLMVQARAVTDPIRNKMVGWWNGMWFYYVKLSDLEERDTITPIFTNFASDLSSLHTAADAKYYHAANSVNWLQLCMKRIVEEYWRYEGEAWDVATIDGLPAAPINLRNWTDSLLLTDTVVADDPSLTVGVDDSFTGREVEDLMLDYHLQQMMGIGSDMSYEDWLRMYGVGVTEEQVHKPELLRFVQAWTYPTNTVEPTDGSVASACVWSHAERADKKRYFKEPGFIVGVMCARPKVYMAGLTSNAADYMDDAKNWLPPFRINDPRISEVEQAASTGPAAVITDADGYKFDIRDLLTYGDQFVNYAMTVGTDNAVNLPEADGDKRYPVLADVDDFFVDETVSGAQNIVADGICNLSILTLQKDQSPTT